MAEKTDGQPIAGLTDLSVRGGNAHTPLISGSPAIGTPPARQANLTLKSDIDHCNPPFSPDDPRSRPREHISSEGVAEDTDDYALDGNVNGT